MNSVFSAFKGNKSEKQKSSLIGGKKINSVQESSYENLRHIREIGSSTKMMTSMVNDDVDEDLLNLHKRPILPSTVINENDCLLSVDVVDHVAAPTSPNNCNLLDSSRVTLVSLKECETTQCQSNNADTSSPLISNVTTTGNSRCSSSCSNSSSTSCELTTIVASPEADSSNNSISSPTTVETSPSPVSGSTPTIPMNKDDNYDSSSISSSTSDTKVNNAGLITDNPTQPIIMALSRGNMNSKNNSKSTPQINTLPNSATTTPKSARYSKPRLSLSGFTNNSMPSVHGRTTTTASNSENANGMPPKIRLSTHQRNLSLDFRSMGILLPPVSQVTNTRINLTQHHRNRSLDSALQRIPEVEVSSPNAETETTFCTNSILGSTMCSKIVTSSSTNPQNTPKNRAPTISTIDTCRPQNCVQNVQQDGTSALPKPSDNKKREDLTSLGSDDSGIICGSESDQVSLNRIRQSHESLDSGEIDAEEECIEILETTSMDEEYRMLQSDLCFYQTPEKDLCAIKNRRRATDDPTGEESENDVETPTAAPSQEYTSDNQNTLKKKKNKKESKIFIPIEDDGESKKNASTDVTPTPMDENANKSVDTQAASKATTPTTAPNTKPEIEPKPEHIKNEILFKNFFGATKNAIFRTAQSIIENHEKKNAAKNKTDDTAAANSSSQSSNQTSSSSATTPTDMKSPTEVSRKKEFFILKPSSSKNKQTNSTPPAETPTETEAKPMTKSISGTSLNKLRVPGVVKCFIKEKEQSQQQVKIEKGPSGLLRFFESPVFNIHFAIHYLFYSKEPGVLSFIGNKIFSFPDQEVDLYIPQLIVMYIQMDELAEVLDPYLTHRCRRSVDFSLKCLWLLEAYNYQIDTLSTNKKNHMSLMKELYNKKERKQQQQQQQQQNQQIQHLNPPQKPIENEILSPIKKTHHRSQSDATGLLNDSKRYASSGTLSLSSKIFPSTPAKLSLGDLSSGRAFDNGCTCFESVRGTVNDLLGQKTVCYCNAPKMAPQKEFMKALINIGKNLTSLQTKAEKTSALRMFLNLINKNLPARVWLPLHSDIPHHVVRITEEKTAVLNSKDKTPYIIYVEVVEVSDIYSSPVILKLMPTLRHTKSEEHLDSKDKNAAGTTSNSNSSSNLSAKDSGADCNSNCTKDSTSISEAGTRNDLNELHFTEDDVWSQEDDEITAQYLNLHKLSERDAISQMSLDSCDSRDQGIPTLFNIGDVRTRHCYNLNCENTKPFSNDPEDPSAAALKEPWHEKEKQIRLSSPYGHLSSWRLLSAIVKCGDDLRQELMATQLLQMFKIIWQEENVDLWVRPYKIVCLSNDSGLIEPILNTVSLHQIKKNSNKSLRDYFVDEYGNLDTTEFKTAQRNFMQSCAAYCLISYLLQVKDRHNGNILLHSDGHLIHIDFGFILSISPKNLGFEQSPFKLTPEFVEVMGGTNSELWTEFNHLLLKGLMAARKHMDRIINLVEIMRSNAQLPCFKNGCSGTVQNLRKRFHMNLTEQELERKVEQLVQDSLKSLSTKLYDGYQYFTNGIL